LPDPEKAINALFPGSALAVLTAWAIIMLALAARTFHWE
jgi:hypothetical protein